MTVIGQGHIVVGKGKIEIVEPVRGSGEIVPVRSVGSIGLNVQKKSQ